MSTSYPYLTVARNHNVPYSAVLSLVDKIEQPLGDCSYFYRHASAWKRDTLNAWIEEQSRRASVMRNRTME